MKSIITVILFTLVAATSSVALADNHSTMRVVAVQTSDVNAYIAEAKKGKQMLMKLDSKMEMRMWRATFAGEAAGTVIVSLEHPGSLSDFATSWEKSLADKQMAAWLDGLSGLRTVMSDSLYQEVPL